MKSFLLLSLSFILLSIHSFAGDVYAVYNIKGIGEKTAMRVILELKNKLRKEGHVPMANSPLRVKDEAISALVTLGFTRNSVDKTLDTLLKTSPSASVEDLIKQALKAL